MTVDTAKVTGRRELRFEWIDDILEEAERIAAAPHVKTLGNWSAGQTLKHLAVGIHMSIDGFPQRLPWYARFLGRLARGWVLKRGMSPGIRLPAPLERSLVPGDDVSVESGLSALREALRRMRDESHREPHPFFGRLSDRQWEELQLRHAELHLSFLLPETASVNSAAD